MYNSILIIRRILNYLFFYFGVIFIKKNRQTYFDFIRLNKFHISPVDELNKLQLNKLNDLLSYANQHVEYYHKVFKNIGLVNSKHDKISLVSHKELMKIPVLSKSELNEFYNDLQSDERNILDYKINSSGGSSGVKAMFLQDYSFYGSSTSNFLFIKKQLGIKPWQKLQLLIWGSQDDIGIATCPKYPILYLLKNSSIKINSGFLSVVEVKDTLNILQKVRFDYIRGYAQSLHFFAKYILENNIKIKKQKLVLSSATVLTKQMKDEIQEAFRCPVYDMYGSREVGPISYECQSNDKLHVLMDHNLLEIVDEKNELVESDQLGRILITNLNNKIMPLIRYEIGDMGIASSQAKCSCGSNYYFYSKTVGRTTSFFKLGNGNLVDGTFLTTILNEITEIKQFQIVQEDILRINFNIIAIKQINSKIKNQVESKFYKIFGDKLKMKWTYLDEIPIGRSGKYEYIISMV